MLWLDVGGHAGSNGCCVWLDPEVTLKALSYFDDGNLRELPTDMKFRLAEAVKAVDLDHLPRLQDSPVSSDRDRGLSL